MRILTPLIGAVCLALVPLAPASAAESRKELGLRLDALTQRILVLENRMLTGDPAAVRLQERTDDLERQLRNQVGENERMRFENARQRADIDDLRRELDLLNTDVQTARDDAATARRALGGYISGGQPADLVDDGQNPFGAVTGTAPAIANDVGELTTVDPGRSAEADFAAARQMLESGFFDQAHVSLERFVSTYNEHPLSGDALFWLGEIQMVRGNASQAAERYLQSLKSFRGGERAPDAMVKLAAAFAAIGDTGEACRTLKLFPKEYPKASAAVKTKADIERRRAGCTP